MTNPATIDESKLVIKNVTPPMVTNQLSYERAVGLRVMAVEKRNLIKETFDPICEKNHSAWKLSVATRAKFLDPIMDLIDRIDSQVKAYKRQQEQIAFEKQQMLRRQAEEKAIKEQEKLNAKAEKLEESGKIEKAEGLREQAANVEVLVPTVAPNLMKVKGDTTRKSYSVIVEDFSKLPESFKVADMQALNALARAKKESFSITGCRLVVD